ncbi:unnamed protein product [Cylindrotheca closterium]|uniref:Protein xylosyltransferase n=1 Tax=Cylindrotheca closterium TaxID=2856 RepID=A0AAD2JNV6_9STRA|nr:unnamed protein product [Cylindrotheca closterium]
MKRNQTAAALLIVVGLLIIRNANFSAEISNLLRSGNDADRNNFGVRSEPPTNDDTLNKNSLNNAHTEQTIQLPSAQSVIPDQSSGKGFKGEKIRDFSSPRAELRKASDSNESLPWENDFKAKCIKWGVVTTIFDPTEAISRVSNLPEWCLVVVADTKTPTNYMEAFETMGGATEVTFFFSSELQNTWEHLDGPIGDFVRTMPLGHVGRKNLGYLFAILHGADFLFDFDDAKFIKVDEVTGKPVEILPSIETIDNVAIAISGPLAFNPYPMMNMSVPAPSWARGFPLQYINDTATQGRAFFQQSMPFVSKSHSIGVIQFLVDGNPDVDTNHRMMHPLPMTFDNSENATNVLVPKHAYCPYNAQATIHTQPALWATLLPTTVPHRVSDIWRSYFAQCIFADSNLRLVFAPPKIEQQIPTERDILADSSAENDLNIKSGKLIHFLSTWDSEHLHFPERVEQLWIDLYERSYIELDDVVAMQKWLKALVAMDYQFPDLKPRFRNVAMMGQFNDAHSHIATTQIMIWSQKQRERFQIAIAAAPVEKAQLAYLEAQHIEVLQSYQLKPIGIGALCCKKLSFECCDDMGYYNPMSNLMRTLLRFGNSSTIEAVLYAHDDALLNLTELSEGRYPFPTDKIIANRQLSEVDNVEYVDLRTIPDRAKAQRFSHRVFPNGTVSDVDKTIFVNNSSELSKKIPKLHDKWERWGHTYCAPAQQQMAMDPEFAKYLDPDGSAWFPFHTQSDFLMVPTKYAEPFAEAVNIHLKYLVWLECAIGKIVDILQQQLQAPTRLVYLCTKFKSKYRGWFSPIYDCNKSNDTIAVFHPLKWRKRFDVFWENSDLINFPLEAQ